MKISALLLIPALVISCIAFSQAQSPTDIRITPAGKGKIDIRVDNMGYWREMIKKGYVLPEPFRETVPAVRGSSVVSGYGIRTQDSPDIPTTGESGSTQSENSVFTGPNDEDEVLNSNNSTTWNGATTALLFGSDCLYSEDGGTSWAGSIQNAGDINFGDPVTAIGRNGRYYIGKINTEYGQSVAWSDNKGATWNEVTIAGVPSPGNDILDKNHLTIDNSLNSPFEGNLYDAWTAFVGIQNGKIEITRSENDGVTWSAPFEISQGVNAVVHNQGVNLQTGPEGEVYAVWALYDIFPGDENALGFTRSLNGGSVFMPATRIINNIRGIRNTGVGKGIRTNSFPSMAVDVSGGSYDGAIYVVWANLGFPGTNTGSDVDIYLIRSFDKGTTWSGPVKINQDPSGLGKKHFFPWITCDPDNGNLAVIYYDDRNTTSTQCETWISYSYDAGDSWTDLKVSDIAFTPAPIPGLAMGYFGDYLGISTKNRNVYPVWTDNRDGKAMSYTSPVDLGPAPGQPFLVYDSHNFKNITDSSSVESVSNEDSLYLSLGIKNIGDEPTSNVTVHVSSPSAYVMITDSIENYGDFSPGEVKTIPYGFAFDVSDTIPDETRIRFNIRCESIDSIWLSHFVTKAKAPDLKITTLIIYDTVSGNRNGRLDPGEEAVLTFRIANNGDYSCENSWVKIRTGSENVIFLQDSVFIGTIVPRGAGNASFNVIVSEDAVFGSWVDLMLDAYSGKYSDDNTFIVTIGIVVEDWETGNFLKYPWQFAGNTGWGINNINPFEGIYSAKSNNIFEQQSAILKIDYTSGVTDSISFWLKTSSEPTFDWLKFYIDDVKQGQWSGETPWKRVSFPVLSGTHNYKWEYMKDIFYDAGDDCAWIDYIEFPPPVLPQVNAGSDDTICGGQAYHVDGTVSGYDSIRWTTYGDGIFSNDTIPDPDYIPGTSDMDSGSVKLRLNAWGQGGTSSNSMILRIGEIPVTSGIAVWPDDTVCAGQYIELSVDTVIGYSYMWTPGGLTTSEILMDTAVTGGTGRFKVVVRTRTAYQCEDMDSVYITFKDCTGIDDQANEFDLSVFPNPFSDNTLITLRTSKKSHLEIIISDQKGSIIKHLADIDISPGFYRFGWDGKNDRNDKVSEGVYNLIINTDKGTSTYKVILLQ